MTPDQITRYRSKAAIVAMAWQQTLAEPPTVHALILAMAVADFETRLGDAGGAWRGEHNWGAIHKRSLTAAEASILLGHGVYPTGDDALRTARGLLNAGANEALHIDKNNVGSYFVWFWAFPNDTVGAGKYLEILVKNRPGVRAIIDSATPVQLAAALYTTKYFEGTSKDPQENIRAYGAQITAYAAKIQSALQGWPPASPPAPGGGTAGVRSAPRGRVGSGSAWWWASIACVGVGAFYFGRRGVA